MTLTLIVIDHRSVGWVIANEHCASVRPAAAAFDPFLDWSRRNEGNLLRHDLRRQRAPRRDVIDDPNTAAVRRQNEIILTRMNREIAHRNSREPIAFELRPIFSAVDRHP